jgi:Zn-finger nucleic acid-binding protein
MFKCNARIKNEVDIDHCRRYKGVWKTEKRQNRIANILVNMKNYIIKNIIVVEQNMSMIMITILDEEKGDF